jgi:low affinity Fe/Cu permease
MFSKIATQVSEFVGSPLATVLAASTVILWAVFGPYFNYSEGWQLIINTGTTIITFLMVFLIQHSQNKDTKAIQTKLDELIRAIDKADDNLAGIEKE